MVSKKYEKIQQIEAVAMGWSLEYHREHTEGITPRITQGNHPGEHTQVRSQECSLGYAPGDNMSS